MRVDITFMDKKHSFPISIRILKKYTIRNTKKQNEGVEKHIFVGHYIQSIVRQNW